MLVATGPVNDNRVHLRLVNTEGAHQMCRLLISLGFMAMLELILVKRIKSLVDAFSVQEVCRLLISVEHYGVDAVKAKLFFEIAFQLICQCIVAGV